MKKHIDTFTQWNGIYKMKARSVGVDTQQIYIEKERIKIYLSNMGPGTWKRKIEVDGKRVPGKSVGISYKDDQGNTFIDFVSELTPTVITIVATRIEKNKVKRVQQTATSLNISDVSFISFGNGKRRRKKKKEKNH